MMGSGKYMSTDPTPNQPTATVREKVHTYIYAVYNTGFVDGQNYAEDETLDEAFVKKAEKELSKLFEALLASETKRVAIEAGRTEILMMNGINVDNIEMYLKNALANYDAELATLNKLDNGSK